MISYKWWPRPSLYNDVWLAMRSLTDTRDARSPDEIWLVEHTPVYTLGQAGKARHILDSGAIPVVHSDRGGQVTYHGPGQVIAYCMVDLRRLGLYAKEYVALLESVVIQLLGDLGVSGVCRKPGAPGVYVPMPAAPGPNASGHQGCGAAVPACAQLPQTGELAKIAALGVKIRSGCSYHGVALNVDMDLTPFSGINPCGYEGLRTVDLRACGIHADVEQVGELLAQRLIQAIESRAQ